MTTKKYNPRLQKSQFPLPKWPQYSNQIRSARGILKRLHDDLDKLAILCVQYDAPFDDTDLDATVKGVIGRIQYKKTHNENSPTYMPKRGK